MKDIPAWLMAVILLHGAALVGAVVSLVLAFGYNSIIGWFRR